MSEVISSYPKWKTLVPTQPSVEDYEQAWKEIFGYLPNECVIKFEEDKNGKNKGFVVRTPTSIHSHGGFTFHTEVPRLKEGENFYYEDYGITWSTDLDGRRFYYIHRQLNLPIEWEKVYSIEVIRNYLHIE